MKQKYLTHLRRMDSCKLTGPFPIKKVFSYFLLLLCFIEMPVFNVNSVETDQIPRSAASDLDLRCLPMSLLWDIGLKRVKL